MALVDICEQITNSIDNHDYCAGVFIDLSKAFDTIDHTILLIKLHHYGIRVVTLDWFKNYLTNRVRFVSIENVYSSSGHITYGVPQGSILGPLLFLIYIPNKTANIIKTKLESVSLSCKSHHSKTANIKILSANSTHRR